MESNEWQTSRGSVRIEYGLISGELLADRVELRIGRPLRRSCGRQAAETHEARHQQQAGFGRGEIPASDEQIDRRGKALVVAAPDARNRHATAHGAQQNLMTRLRPRPAIR